MNKATFKWLDPLSKLSFSERSKTVGGRRSIYNAGVMRLFRHFLQKPAREAFSHRVTAKSIKNDQQEVRLTTLPLVTSYLLD